MVFQNLPIFSLEWFHEIFKVVLVRFLLEDFDQGLLKLDTLGQTFPYRVCVYGA